MGLELGIFQDDNLEADYIEWLIDEHSASIERHFCKLWDYYSNPILESVGTACDRKVSDSGRCYVQAQEVGLPSRITGLVQRPGTGAFGGQSPW